MEEEISNFLKENGAISVGFTNTERLKNGPPSTQLSKYMNNAISAIVFALPLDREIIRAYIAKSHINARSDHEIDNFRTNIRAYHLGLDVAEMIRSKGSEAKAIFPNSEFESYDIKGFFKAKPIISLRYLAAVSGVGSFGWSGNIGIKGYGASILLGGILTSAKLKPTLPLPESENFCDKCKICVNVCGFRMFSKTEPQQVKIGKENFTYSKRIDQVRCDIVCGGFNGLDKSKNWSTWAAGRFDYPENEKEAIKTLAKSFRLRPSILVDGEEGGFKSEEFFEEPQAAQFFEENPYTLFLLNFIKLSCGFCQVICSGNRKETIENYKILKNSGVVIRKKNGKTQILKGDDIKNADELTYKNKRNVIEKISGYFIRKALSKGRTIPIPKIYVNRSNAKIKKKIDKS